MEEDELAEYYDDGDDDYSLFNADEEEINRRQRAKELKREKLKEKAAEKQTRKGNKQKEKNDKDFIEVLKSIDFDLKNASLVDNITDYNNEVINEYDSSEGEMSDSCCEKIKKLVGFEVDLPKKRKHNRTRKSLPPEIERKMGEANLHYTLREFNEAISLLHEVIKSKPNIPEPYQTLGLIYEESNEISKAIDLYIVAAFLSSKKDPSVWSNLAHMCLENNDPNQALYCFNKVIKRNPADVNALWDKSILLIQMNEYKKATDCLRAILKIRKGDSQVTIELARLYFVKLNNIPLAIETLQKTIAYTLTQDKLDMNVANMLMELYMVSGDYNHAIDVIKLLCKGKAPELDQFPMEIIVFYGICEAHIGNLDIAAKNFDHLLEQSPSKYSDLYYQVAETYLAIGECKKAITFYTSLLSDPNYNNPPIWIKLGRCEKRLHNYHAAIMHYQSVNEIIPDEYESSIALCDIYKENNMPDKALEVLEKNTNYLLKQNLMPDPRIISAKAQLHLELNQEEKYLEAITLLFDSEFLRANKDFYPNQRKRLRRPEADLFAEENINEKDDEVDEVDDADDSQDDDDDFEGIPPPPEALINNNNNNSQSDMERVLMLKGKRRKRRVKSGPTQPGILELVGEDQFFGLVVSTIKKLFVDKNYDKIAEMLDSILSNVNFPNEKRLSQLRRLLIAVALSRGDSDLSFNQIRTMCKEFPYCIRIWQLFSLVVSKDNKPDRAQKILLRLEEKYPDSLPIKIMIGHLYSISGNLAHALSAYYKVYQSAPNDPFINLYIALVYLGQVMNRKLANRHFCVIQSFAHLYQYYQHRSSKHEANYNMGRAFQQLGLNHLAVVYYECALAEHANDKSKTSDLTREIAYNLSLIYKASGSPELARQLLLEYLCF